MTNDGGARLEVQFDREAIQTRDYCVAKNATRRAGRPDPLGELGAGSSLRKKRLLRMTIIPHHFPLSPFLLLVVERE